MLDIISFLIDFNNMGIHFDNSSDEKKKCPWSNLYFMVINLPLGNLRQEMVPDRARRTIRIFSSCLKLTLIAICESCNQFSWLNMTQLLRWPECFFISSPQNWIILKISTTSYHDYLVMTVPICCGYGNYTNATTTSDTGYIVIWSEVILRWFNLCMMRITCAQTLKKV